MPEEYTNRELARDYFYVDSYQCSDIMGKLEMKRNLETFETDISKFYKENHALPKKDFRPCVRRILELILEHGAEEALETIKRERIKKMEMNIIFDDKPKPRILDTTNPFA